MTPPNPARLGPITCVTFTAPDLDAVRECYSRYFDYRVIEDGQIEAALASQWGAPAVAGRPYTLLAPAAASDFLFRVIEGPADPGYVPFATYGWNAAELMVEHVDSMAARLQGSPFRVVGEPQDLSFNTDIRAMQILGPGNELLYLTEFKRQVPGLDVPAARCAVDRTFIVILGGPSMDSLQDFYAQQFSVPRAAAVESRVKGMSAAFGLPAEHRHPIAALPLAGQSLIEADQMPPAATPRPAAEGDLPAGISIVTFTGDASGLNLRPASGLLYAPAGQQAACLHGAAGEIIEILPG